MTIREKLQASPAIKDVAAMVQSNLFEHCCDVAMLTLVENFSPTMDLPQAAALQQQLAGAKRFVTILKDLATIPSPPKANRIGQLNPQ